MDFLLYGLLVYICVVGGLYFAQRTFIYFPDITKPSKTFYNASDMETVSVTTEDGITLEGWYREPEEGKPVVVLFHGNAGNIGFRAFSARPVLDKGYGFLLCGYRGYGGNPGKPTEQGLYIDARAYLDWLLDKRGFKQKDIVLYAESLGTGVAVQMATEYEDVGGIILEAPYTTLPDVASKTYFFAPTDLLMKDQFRNIDKIADVNAPLLIVHGERDNIVTVKLGKRLFKAANEPKEMVVLPRAGHNDLHFHGTSQIILGYLESLPEH